MIRHRQDIRSLFFIGLNLLVLALGLYTPVGLPSLIIVPLMFALSYICLTVNHNQLHQGIFFSTPANVFTNIALSVGTGAPVTMIYLPHVRNHHPNPCTSEDWAGAHLAGEHRGPLRAIIYIFRAQIAPMKLRPPSPFAGLSRLRKLSLSLEFIALGSYIIFALWTHPGSFLLHNFLPWFASMNALILMNFALHDGCEYESEFNHSLTFTSKMGNFFLLNNGYHLAHHMKPKMHWSELPEFHRQFVQGKFRPEYEKEAILSHLASRYLFPPKITKNEVVTNKAQQES